MPPPSMAIAAAAHKPEYGRLSFVLITSSYKGRILSIVRYGQLDLLHSRTDAMGLLAEALITACILATGGWILNYFYQ